MAFETSCFDRVVTLGDTTHRIEAPSVGLGLQILYILDHIDPDDPDDVEDLFHYLDKLSWDTETALIDLRRFHRLNPSLFYAQIKQLILQGHEIPDAIKKKIEKLENSKKPTWRFLLAEYCRAFNADPYDVWQNTPLTFFLEMNREIRPLVLRDRLDQFRAVGAGMSGSEQVEDWHEEAYATIFSEDLYNEESEESEPLSSEEKHRRELEREREFLSKNS